MLDLAGTDQRTRIRNDALGRPQRRHSQTFLLSPEWPDPKLDVDKPSLLSHTGCLRPEHIYCGLEANNMANRQRAGGFPRGEEHPTSFSPKPTSSLSLPCCTRATALSQSQSNSAFLGKRSTTLPSAALGHVLLAPRASPLAPTASSPKHKSKKSARYSRLATPQIPAIAPQFGVT